MFEHDRPASPRGPAPRRPLPLLPLVHDHLSQRRRLHASRRSRPRPHRGDRQARLQGAPAPARCSRPSCPIPTASVSRSGRRAWRSPSPGSCAGSGSRSSSAMLELAPAGLLRGADFTGPGTAATKAERRRARDPARRLRPAGAAARDQRRHHPPAGAARRRRGGGAGRRLLRRAGAPHGPGGRRHRLRQAQHRRLDAADGQGRPHRRRHRQHVGLRHHRQGLRATCWRASPHMPSGRPSSPA